MRKNWTREETIVAFNLYCKIPFKSSSQNHPLVIQYAKLLKRSPSALNMKIGNFGRLDPELKSQGITGLTHGAVMEEEVWNEFQGNWDLLAFESQRIMAKLAKRNLPDSNEFDLPDEIDVVGRDQKRLVKTRVNQKFFRDSILAVYEGHCCITGLAVPELLVASHIIPWARDEKNRTNPSNGLCLNALHDMAFDKGFITVTTDYRVAVSEVIRKEEMVANKFVRDALLAYEGKKIALPHKFLPRKEFLEYHNDVIFRK